MHADGAIAGLDARFIELARASGRPRGTFKSVVPAAY